MLPLPREQALTSAETWHKLQIYLDPPLDCFALFLPTSCHPCVYVRARESRLLSKYTSLWSRLHKAMRDHMMIAL